MCDAEFWRAQAVALSDICDIHLPAYGLLNSIAQMAARVIEGAPERFSVAGHSMGGRVAQEIVRRVPHRVLRLGLSATDFRGPTSAEARADEARQRAALLGRVATEGMTGWAREWAREMVSPAHRRDEALLGAIEAMVLRQTPEQLAAQTLAGLNRPDFAPVLSGIACPTLVIAGSEDRLRSVETHREMAALIPNSRLAVLEGCGHMVAMEEPGAVTALMRQWLST
jgi:pimeloyl-ACP methyl ester carboxylesterase